MNKKSNKDYYFDIDLVFKYLVIFVPISIIIGNFALNINIILIDLLFFYLLYKKKITLKKNFLLFLIILSTIICVNYFFSSNIFLTARGILGIIKYIIFFLALIIFFNIEKNKNLFFKFIFYVILFVVLDVFIQYYLGKDLFGIEYHTSHGNRMSGPFGDELVVGAYLSKIAVFGLIYLNYLKKNHYYFFSYLLILLLGILVTQERSAFFISLISFSFFVLFLKINIKKKMVFFLIFPIFLFIFFKFDENSYNKYYKLTILQLGLTDEFHYRSYATESKKAIKHKINNFWDSRYGAHFLTSYEIFLDNKILGSGIKTFRTSCGLKKYDNIDSLYTDTRCNTHPHNLYFELLSEGGLLLFIPFCLIILFFLTSNIKNLITNNNYINSLINLSLLIILFFPIQTTGSFFSTFNGVFYWIGLAVISQNMQLNFFWNSPQINKDT